MHHRTSAILIFWRSYGHLKITSFVWRLYGASVYREIQYKYFTGTYRCDWESLRGKKLFFKDATQKSAFVVQCGIDIESVPRRPIFEKCSHLREKGGVLTLRTPVGFVMTHTVRAHSKKPAFRDIYQQVLQPGANEASAQGLQNDI